MTEPAQTPGQVFSRVALASAAIAVGIALVAGAVYWLVAGQDAAVAAAIGAALPGLVIGSLAGLMYATRDASPSVLAAAVLGGFLVLMIVLIAVLWGLGQWEGFPRAPLGVAALVSIVAILTASWVIVGRSRVPYAGPK